LFDGLCDSLFREFFLMKYFRNAMKFGALMGASMLGASAAFAVGTPLDVTAVTDSLSAQITPITLVGGGILTLAALVAAIAWVRRPIH
jgi:TRAP-type C4-dicarboxylate transport system permease small subunit